MIITDAQLKVGDFVFLFFTVVSIVLMFCWSVRDKSKK